MFLRLRYEVGNLWRRIITLEFELDQKYFGTGVLNLLS